MRGPQIYRPIRRTVKREGAWRPLSLEGITDEGDPQLSPGSGEDLRHIEAAGAIGNTFPGQVELGRPDQTGALAGVDRLGGAAAGQGGSGLDLDEHQGARLL